MTILLLAATAPELQITVDWLKQPGCPCPHSVELLVTGVGELATSYALTKALSKRKYDLVLGAGIAGAYYTQLALGTCILVRSEVQGDLGAEDHDQFLNIFELGLLGQNEAPFQSKQLINPMSVPPFPAEHLEWVAGLSVNTVSGSTDTIHKRQMHFHPQIESMEGAALHYCCLQEQQAFLQLRSISNYVTPRDRNSWKIGLALSELNAQLIKWLSIPL